MTASSVEDAVKNARYNEAVIVTISNEENTENREIVLVATLDKVNGGVSWQDAGILSSNRDFDDVDIGIQRHLRTKIWIKPMLNDTHRNNLYSSSISKACLAVIKNQKLNEGDHSTEESIRILDIGSGTGLLAMLAARSMQSCQNLPVQVTSIEMASAMARLARKIVKSNNLDKSIDVVEGHSCSNDFNPYQCDKKAILCTSELLETGLLGEGIIPAMRDAWDRHLANDALVVPQRARVYAQVVEGLCCVHNYCGPYYDQDNDAIVRLSTDGEGNKSSLLGGKGGVLVPIHAGALLENVDSSDFLAPADSARRSGNRATILSEPQLVLEFDFTSKEKIPPPSGRSFEKEFTAIKSGLAHGVLFWWELDLWDGETYSTELGKNWQDHWQQCLFVFGADCENLTEGQSFTLVSSHDDTSIAFRISLNKCTKNDEHLPKKQRVEDENAPLNCFQNHITYDRALQLNDKDRMSVLYDAIKNAIECKGKSCIMLDISDFSLCSIIAAKTFGAENVTSLESSSNGIPYLAALVAQVGNQLPRKGCIFQVINAHAENLRIDHIGGEVDIVMAEPYFEILESWHIEEALNYYFLLRSLKQRNIVKKDAISLPSSASIVACAVQLDESVSKSYCSQISSLCGFSHEEITKHGNSYNMKLSSFQYKWKRLSPNFIIANLQYDGPFPTMDTEWSEAEIDCGECHGIFMWVEYKYGLNSIVTTGNRYHQQAFRFLNSPVFVKKDDHIFVKPTFNTQTLEDYEIEIMIKRK